MRITLNWGLFRRESDRAWSEGVMQRLLDLMVEVNEYWLRKKPSEPPLYEGGVRYSQEGRGDETWQAVPVIRDTADCEDLACWRAAELRVTGEDPDARAIFRGQPVAPRRVLYHVVVQRGDGSIEDPSKRLGMGTYRRRGV